MKRKTMCISDTQKQGFIGHPAQLCTLRRLAIAEGKARGTQVIEVITAGGLQADILPEGFSASCQLLEVDDIHEDAMEAIDGWIIGEYMIEVFDKDGNRMTETHVRKILKEDDFE